MNAMKKMLAIFNMEELCLLSIYAEISDSINILRNKLLHALHESADKEMLIIYGTVLCKIDGITGDEYRSARENNFFRLD